MTNQNPTVENSSDDANPLQEPPVAAYTFGAAMSIALSRDVLTVLRVAKQVVTAHRDTFQISDLASISARLRMLAAEVDQFVGWGEFAVDNYDNEMHFLNDNDDDCQKTDFDVDFSRALAEVPDPETILVEVNND